MVRSINNVAFLHWIQNIFSRKLSLKMILIRVITNRETNKIPTHSWEPFLFHKAYSAYEKFSILCSHIWGIALYWDRRLVQWMWSDVLGLHQIGSLSVYFMYKHSDYLWKLWLVKLKKIWLSKVKTTIFFACEKGIVMFE